jgi:hypothetical protein
MLAEYLTLAQMPIQNVADGEWAPSQVAPALLGALQRIAPPAVKPKLGEEKGGTDSTPPPCPICGGEWPETSRIEQRPCPECFSRSISREGMFSELWVPGDCIQKYGEKPEKLGAYDSLNKFSEWPAIQDCACELFGHSVFNSATWQRLKTWLLARPEKTFQVQRAEVVRLLREAVAKKAGLPTPPAAKTKTGKGKGGKRGRTPDTDPKKDKRLAEAWATGRYRTFAELDTAEKLGKGEAKRAVDRHRHRTKARE